jgi:hypothetical protein
LEQGWFFDPGEMLMSEPEALVNKIRALPPERIAEVEDFIDFLRMRERERALTGAAAVASEAVFGAIWSNPEDDVYNAL